MFLAESDKDTGAPAPKILVREECRERWGEYVCDGRRPINEIMPEFPHFDFSEVGCCVSGVGRRVLCVRGRVWCGVLGVVCRVSGVGCRVRACPSSRTWTSQR